jgi:hypothetical protein
MCLVSGKIISCSKKDTSDQYRENYSSGYAIENIENSYSQIEMWVVMIMTSTMMNLIVSVTKGWKAPMLTL